VRGLAGLQVYALERTQALDRLVREALLLVSVELSNF